MKTNKRGLLIGFVVLLALLMAGLFATGGSHVVIDGDEVTGIGGVAGLLFGLLVAFVAIVFALSVTGLVLAGVALVLVVVVAAVLGSFALALLPFLFPILIIWALFSLFRTKKQTA
ncbi:MAG: hypothetical protein E6Q34_07580 [Burkholderiaceae bacterium]|nr:MAG: hypothetical protein E6Q34_07580 [Burkholderiaceae bacterium]